MIKFYISTILLFFKFVVFVNSFCFLLLLVASDLKKEAFKIHVYVHRNDSLYVANLKEN